MSSGALIKAVARIVHFTSMFLLAAYFTGTFLFKDNLEGVPVWIHEAGKYSGMGFLASGLVNWYILKKFKIYGDRTALILWHLIIDTKLTAILTVMTPLAKYITDDFWLLYKLRAGVVVFSILTSPIARMLREKATRNGVIQGIGVQGKKNK